MIRTDIVCKKKSIKTFAKGLTYLIISTLLTSWQPVFAQDSKAFTPENIYKLKSVQDPKISPDGKKIVFVVFTPDDPSQTDIWITNTDGRSEPQKYAYGNQSDFSPQWSPDGKYLAFLSRRDTDKNMQVYLVNTDKKITVALTQVENGINAFKWRSDSKAIAYTTIDKRDSSTVESIKIQDSSPQYNRLYEIELDNRKPKLLFDQDSNVSEFNYSHDGTKMILKISSTETDEIIYRSKLLLIDLKKKTPPITIVKRIGITMFGSGSISWSPNDRKILIFNPSGKYGKTVVPAIVDLASKKIEPLFEFYSGYINSVQWISEDNLAFSAYQSVNSKIGIYVISKNKILFEKEVGFPFTSIDVDRNGERLVYIKASSNSSPQIWTCNNNGSSEKQLTTYNPEVHSWKFGKEKIVRWKSTDGLEIEGVLILPAEYNNEEPLPIITQIHGGPEWVWSTGWNPEAHFFTNNGYAVFKPNIRGSQGYGVDFIEKNYADLGGGDFQDIITGVDYLIKIGIANPDKLALEGWSYGGYMTAWSISHTKIFKTAIVGAGTVDLVAQYKTSDNDIMWEYYMQGTPYDNEDMYKKHSPITYLKNIDTPTLILHGEKDIRVPTFQAKMLYHDLQKFGIESQLVIYDGEGHGIRKLAHRVDLLNRKLKWYNEHLIDISN